MGREAFERTVARVAPEAVNEEVARRKVAAIAEDYDRKPKPTKQAAMPRREDWAQARHEIPVPSLRQFAEGVEFGPPSPAVGYAATPAVAEAFEELRKSRAAK